jgi:hypothetical protein
MVKGGSLRRSGSDTQKKDARENYDYLKEIIKVASKNGWDMESLGLVSKDLPSNPDRPLTKKDYQDLNRSVGNALKRFDKALTPPVPLDLEESIRARKKENWLPWEAEAIEKIEAWRSDVKKVKPRILEELNRVGLSDSDRP